MMLFSICLSTSDTVYEVQGLFVCFCHGTYISSLTQGLKTSSCANTKHSAGAESSDRLAGMFATLIHWVWSKWSSGQRNCPSTGASNFKALRWQANTMLKCPWILTNSGGKLLQLTIASVLPVKWREVKNFISKQIIHTEKETSAYALSDGCWWVKRNSLLQHLLKVTQK